MNLTKYIAASGFCSRRKAEDLIRSGLVRVNGRIAELGMKVSEDAEVEINGKKIALQKEKIYIILNKPIDVTCTNRKFKNEKNVFDFLPSEFRSLFVVGRLDKDSRGLVLLTNDGDLTLKLTHPRYEHEKKYVVEIKEARSWKLEKKSAEDIGYLGTWVIGDLEKNMKKGIDIGEGDGVTAVKDVRYLGENKFEVILTEGKKRQIRRMFGALGLGVIDLVRVSIGEIELGDLQEGQWRKILIDT